MTIRHLKGPSTQNCHIFKSNILWTANKIYKSHVAVAHVDVDAVNHH